ELAKCLECSRSLVIEVSARHLRIAFHRSGEITTDVAAILAEKRAGVVLGMALVEDKDRLAAEKESVDTRLVGAGNDLISGRGKWLRIHSIEPGVGNAPG